MVLSMEHANLRLRYLNERLAGLPSGRIMARRSHGKSYEVVYIRSFNKMPSLNKRYFSMNREPGRTLAALVKEANDVRHEISEIRHYVNGVSTSSHRPSTLKRRSEPRALNGDFYKELKKTEDSNTYPKPANAIEHNGILMRTKSEVLLAQLLDRLGLEYAYESCADIGGEIYPDFTVYIPEIDKVFFIEYMGALSNPKYLYKAGERFKRYIEEGYIPGRDVIFICETDDQALDTQLIASQINALIMANTCIG